MPDKSKIEWTDATWNPITGCSKVSPGCARCYAERVSLRFRHSLAPWTPENAQDNVQLHPERLDQPLRWRRPRRVFVNSMSDLFHELVPDDYIASVFDIMGASPQHQFQVLTKRPDRMAEWFDFVGICLMRDGVIRGCRLVGDWKWPLDNVWLGVSVENQRWADRRIPLLRRTPASLRFLSCEPLIRPLDLSDHLIGVDWVIVGGESGPGARPIAIEWVRDLIDQCATAQVSVFVKQLGTAWSKAVGASDHKGGDWDEWPEDLRVREYPGLTRAIDQCG